MNAKDAAVLNNVLDDALHEDISAGIALDTATLLESSNLTAAVFWGGGANGGSSRNVD